MNRILLCAVVLMFALCAVAQIAPPPSQPTVVAAPSGTVFAPEGYYHWQYGIYTHTAQVLIESGLSQPGLHQFTVQLPRQVLVREIHATHDYAPWCAGSGYEVVINVAAPGSFDALLADKTFSGGQPEMHTFLRADFSGAIGGGLPATEIELNYFQDMSCVSATDSWTLNFVIN